MFGVIARVGVVLGVTWAAFTGVGALQAHGSQVPVPPACSWSPVASVGSVVVVHTTCTDGSGSYVKIGGQS
jgi:hypothetical protein